MIVQVCELTQSKGSILERLAGSRDALGAEESAACAAMERVLAALRQLALRVLAAGLHPWMSEMLEVLDSADAASGAAAAISNVRENDERMKRFIYQVREFELFIKRSLCVRAREEQI